MVESPANANVAPSESLSIEPTLDFCLLRRGSSRTLQLTHMLYAQHSARLPLRIGRRTRRDFHYQASLRVKLTRLNLMQTLGVLIIWPHQAPAQTISHVTAKVASGAPSQFPGRAGRVFTPNCL